MSLREAIQEREKCGTCAFARDFLFPFKGPGLSCQRWPPVPMPGQGGTVVSVFPPVDWEWGCGEWCEREQELVEPEPEPKVEEVEVPKARVGRPRVLGRKK